MMMSFTQKLNQAQTSSRGQWALYVSPEVETLPFEIQRYDDPFLPYMRTIYQATHDLTCAYMLDFGAYLRLGAAGAVALERSIDLIGDTHPVILDTAFASERYQGLWEETAYGCDALTIADARVLKAYQGREDRAAFLMTSGEADGRLSPTYWTDKALLSANSLYVRLLPDDVLFKARSLNFVDTLRTLVMAAIEHG